MQTQQQVNPIKVSRGYIAVSVPDWSQLTYTVYDFSNQGTGARFRQIAGLWVDNTNNTNSITISLDGTGQIFKVYGGEQATFPVFTTDYPRLKCVCNNDVTPGVGSTQLIFTDFDIGFNIAQTGSGASIIVSDTNLLAYLTASTNNFPGSGTASHGFAQMPVSYAGTWTTSQIALAAGNQSILTASHARMFNIQNISADPVYINIGAAAVASATNGSYKLAAGASFNNMSFSNWVYYYANIFACPTNAGDTINIQYN